jgi:hypothetical protein
LQAICLGWLQITILMISASWEARITGMNQWYPARKDPIRLMQPNFLLVESQNIPLSSV